MTIQKYFEEKEQREKESGGASDGSQEPALSAPEQQESLIVPVVQEQAQINTVQTETGKVNIRKTVSEVEKSVNIPLMKEGYSIEKVPVNVFIESTPPVREEGDTIIIPVVREVLVVEKRLELVEEIRITKQQTIVEHKETVKLKKEEVDIQRTPLENRKP